MLKLLHVLVHKCFSSDAKKNIKRLQIFFQINFKQNKTKTFAHFHKFVFIRSLHDALRWILGKRDISRKLCHSRPNVHKNLKTTKANIFIAVFVSLLTKGKNILKKHIDTHTRPHRKFCGGGRKNSEETQSEGKKNFNAIIIFYPRLMNAAHFYLSRSTTQNRSLCFIRSNTAGVTAIWRRPCSERQAGKKRRKKKGMEWKKKKNPINFTFSFFFSLPFKPYRSRILMKPS